MHACASVSETAGVFFVQGLIFLLNEIGIFFLTVSKKFILTNFLNLIKYALFLT